MKMGEDRGEILTLWLITTLGKDSPYAQETSQAARSHNQRGGMKGLQGSFIVNGTIGNEKSCWRVWKKKYRQRKILQGKISHWPSQGQTFCLLNHTNTMASFDSWCWNKHPGTKLLRKKRCIWLTVPGYSSLLRKSGKNLKVSNPVKSKYILSSLFHCSRPLDQGMVPSTGGLVFYTN